ncbi:hypothetical protein LFT50_30815 (plasmid) [Mycobacterium intracellulare subsp. chimaera]|uniref:hypothetical protein n=1 Tax=Mycobacterium intracellulare TaxID=1767 RepID=UPI001CF1A196|nr:hypothetical protein [Mycobacterium intracellulare]UCN13100.1 hypothetical protein LFT50_30815 [Mycobacterium intracellulare subsp. chimaera]
MAAPAAHHWTPRDLNALITDWAGVNGRRTPDRPHKPIGLLGAILVWHGRERLDERPAALEEAREAAEAAAHRAHLAAQRAARETTAAARAAGRAALSGPGHAAARAVLADIARRRGSPRRDPVSLDTDAQP